VFKKILIANRAEIACRIIKTARRLGIATVAVHSEADGNALHVEMADEAVPIGAAPSAESYLVIERIVDACRSTGSDAVHPGYGFLSENAAFAGALKDAGIAFIGPPVEAITAMGDKITSKRLAEKAGVNTIPGHTEVISDAGEAVRVAAEIGYPVMLKASAGGGGKGMRVARDETQCRDGFERARSEAGASFGDDRVFIEKYIDEPRHIEIQVLGDTHGNLVYLGERECSIQRRHQKVIEEAPSTFVDAKMRDAMGSQALALARAVGYCSAGTVEFIVDQDHRFYFLEMNTRLQVEHPVTEAVTGVDLVELMIRVAAGEPLGMEQSDVALDGWALEARIYAEDPVRGFLPSSGRLIRFRAPVEGSGVRVDTGVYEGGEISVFYDPMIAKLITHGRDRQAASERMQRALDEFYIRGVSHNIDFLAAIIKQPRFVEGRLTTSFIDEEFPNGYEPHLMNAEEWRTLVCVAASVHHRRRSRDAEISGQMPGGEGPRGEDWLVVHHGTSCPVQVTGEGSVDQVWYDGEPVDVSSDWSPGEPVYRGRVEEAEVRVQVELSGIAYRLAMGGCVVELRVLSPRAAGLHALMPAKESLESSRFLLAPMPGLLVSVAVEAGDDVKAGQELAIVEAMKMENVLRANEDLTVAAVLVSPGDSLSVDQPIIEFA
jgi:propionyl-CoA carboxylase alpha chain